MIRPAHHDEASLLTDLAFRSKAYWGYSEEFMELCRDELTISGAYLGKHACFVLEAERRLAGFTSLERMTGTRVELGHLFIEPSEIGHGYGKQLMTHALAEARSRGYRVLEIQADPNAESFYRSCGARRVGMKPSASIAGRDLPLMELELQK
ncbi:MAG: GNAT family N-acetyltransferase [Gammaproteobacteria bacterium]|jgi:GNAT superfamily N-acetyltransferase|nr:GNAT family N-acetyltransferase [Gammaproteobacteria bacterium]